MRRSDLKESDNSIVHHWVSKLIFLIGDHLVDYIGED